MSKRRRNVCHNSSTSVASGSGAGAIVYAGGLPQPDRFALDLDAISPTTGAWLGAGVTARMSVLWPRSPCEYPSCCSSDTDSQHICLV